MSQSLERSARGAIRAYVRVGLLVAATSIAGACGSTAATPSHTPSAASPAAPSSTGIADPAVTPSQVTPSAASPTTSASPLPDDTVWLCKPGLANNPCAGNLDATVVDASGRATLQRNPLPADPPIDCFYVYPTVSRQSGTNANLRIDSEERAVALAQAAQFSRVCDVYAPMYPQLTLAAISRPGGITPAGALKAYAGVSAAFADYLANYNHGRGIVFVGHSQGASMLIALLKYQVDNDQTTRGRLVSALLLGGNVTVQKGRTIGGDFANIPACQSSTQTGCVVAYSTFDTTPPANSFFGRPTSSLNPFAQNAADLQVLCVNPAAMGGGAGKLVPYFPTSGLSTLLGGGVKVPAANTPFISYPDEYSARCESAGGATWLQLTRTSGASDQRPTLRAAQSPQWGQHVVDVNIALGNLVELVATEAAAFQ